MKSKLKHKLKKIMLGEINIEIAATPSSPLRRRCFQCFKCLHSVAKQNKTKQQQPKKKQSIN